MTKDEAEDTRRHFDVVSEDLRSEFRLVAEGVAGNTERMERLEKETRAGFERVDLRLGRVEGEMREGFRVLGERVGRLEAKQTL